MKLIHILRLEMLWVYINHCLLAMLRGVPLVHSYK